MARLIVVSGAPDGGDRTVELTGDSVSVGRDASNAIPLDKEGKASRRHCQVTPVSGGAYEVSDLKSTNGTRVNGEPVERRRLRPGDVIEVGLTRIRFEDDAAAAALAATGDACYLEWTAGDRKGERVPLTTARTTFGRRDTNTVPLEDKMASGHHAEITRDLNGFTVRDLGSTNGTLVNGEPITEVALKHGDRVRVGNARFAFKDPSMKDIDLGDAAGDDDAGDWGMMADVDASARAKGSGRGLAAAAVLIAALGGGAYVAANQKTDDGGAFFDVANQVDDGSFDSPDLLSWGADEGAPLSVERGTSGGAPKGGPHLVVRRTDAGGAGLAVASYSEELDTKDNEAYRVSARMSRDGTGRAALAIQWSRLGNVRSGSTAVSQTVRVGTPERTGSWASVERVVRRPGWAKSGRLVLIVGPDASARLDDVRFEVATSAAGAAGRLEGDKGIEVMASMTGGIDLLRNSTVLAVGATPWARFADGRVVGGPAAFVVDGPPAASGDGAIEFKGRLVDDKGAVPASIRWSKIPEGLSAAISVDGADAVGLSADFPKAHLAEQLKVRSGTGSKVVEPTGGIDLDGATRVLVGDAERRIDVNRPETLLALDLPADAKTGRLSTYAADDTGLLRVALWRAGASGDVRLVMNFDGERQRAQQALRDAKALVDKSAGPGIKRLYAVADEFPFETEIRTQALAVARQREDRAQKDLKGLQQGLDLFAVYRDQPSLADATRRADELDVQFPASGEASQQEASIREAISKARTARLAHEIATAGPEVKRLTRLAKLLEQEQGFEVMAALYYDAVVHRFGELESAAGAPELSSQIADCRKSLATLLEKPGVRASFPNLPEGDEKKGGK